MRHLVDVQFMPNKIERSLSHLGFIQIQPSARLAEVVECYWFLKTNASANINSIEYLHSNGGMGIVLNFADPISFRDHRYSDTCIFKGTSTFTKEVALYGALETVGIRFKPAGASFFLPLPLSELKDQAVSLSELNIKNHPDLYSKVYEANTITKKVLTIENWLCKFFNSNNHIPYIVDEALAYIEKHNGIKKIASLTEYLNLDKRKLERLFQHQVGLSPKEYSRNIRIEKAREYIKHSNNNSLSNIAYDLGYYDQPHFINQFKKIEGITPREYMRKAFNKDYH